jgi:hypothetical protein
MMGSAEQLTARAATSNSTTTERPAIIISLVVSDRRCGWKNSLYRLDVGYRPRKDEDQVHRRLQSDLLSLLWNQERLWTVRRAI